MKRLLIVIFFFFSSCYSDKSNPFSYKTVQLSGEPAFNNDNYLRIINDVIKFHFKDSIIAHKAYYPLVEHSITNRMEIDSSTTRVVCKSANGDLFEFYFANYQKCYLTVYMNNMIIYENHEFPNLPELEKMKFSDTGSNLLIH